MPLEHEKAAVPRSLTLADLPPSYQAAPGVGNKRDLRGRILGIQQAAELVGYGRTQMWRDARDGKVKCIVEGTPSRPVYRFLYEDLLEYRERRESQKALDRERAERQAKRRMQRAQPALQAAVIILGGSQQAHGWNRLVTSTRPKAG